MNSRENSLDPSSTVYSYMYYVSSLGYAMKVTVASRRLRNSLFFISYPFFLYFYSSSLLFLLLLHPVLFFTDISFASHFYVRTSLAKLKS